MTKFLRLPVVTERGTVILNASKCTSIYVVNNSKYQKISFSAGLNQYVDIDFKGPYYFSGTQTSATSNRLIDSNADFVAAGVQPGDYAKSLQGSFEDNIEIVSVVSPTELEVTGWTPVAGNAYSIYRPSDALKIMDSIIDAIDKAFSTKWTETIIDIELPSGLTIVDYYFGTH